MFLLHKRLKHIKIRLKDWNKNEFGNIFEAKKVVERKLHDINQILITNGFNEGSKEQANKHQQEWKELCKQEEIFWKQKLRGIVEEPLLDISQFINDFTKHIPKLVTRDDNHNINRPMNEDEVSEAIKEMQNGKAPGPDGFNVDFFKACWGIVKQDILDVVEDLRKNRTVLKALNTSFLSLIPK
eukprot:PITA_20517